MSSTKVAVVIPTYKEELNELEKISLAQARKVLGKYPFVFVAPEGKNFSYFKSGDMIADCPPQLFQNTKTYNQLMMSPQFYEAFLNFDYVLIYQLDAFVFYDALEIFCSLGYDYIGAAWPLMYSVSINKKYPRVGNGGFSLRKVKVHYNLLRNNPELIRQYQANEMPEDVFFAHCGKIPECDFHVAPINIAYKFSAEFNPLRVIKKNGGQLPFGCHDWNLYNPEFYKNIFLRFGYDLRNVKNMSVNYDDNLTNWLLKIAIKRLICRAERGQSILRYLPTEHFDSVCVIRDSNTMKVLAQLLTEKNFLADKIFLYDKDNVPNLIDDVTRENLPHLLLTLEDYDTSLIDNIEKKGLRYGEHIISFRREYLNHCEKLFHNLGK